MAVTEDELLQCWKGFFGNGTNWKDLDKEITYERLSLEVESDVGRNTCHNQVLFVGLKLLGSL